MTDPHIEVVAKHAPGALGALTAAILLRGPQSIWRRLTLFAAGVGASAYGAPTVASATGAAAELAGFLVGLFAMAAAAKVLEIIESIEPGALIERVLKKLGL